MKRLTALIAAAAVCLSLAGCSRSEGTSTAESATAEVTTTAAATAEPEATTTTATTAEPEVTTAATTAAPEVTTTAAITEEPEQAETDEASESAEAETAPDEDGAPEMGLTGDGSNIEMTLPADGYSLTYMFGFDEDSMLSSAVLRVVSDGEKTIEDIISEGELDETSTDFIERNGGWEAGMPLDSFGEDEESRSYDGVYQQCAFIYALYSGMMDIVDDYTDQYEDIVEGEYKLEPYFGVKYYTYDENDNEIAVTGLMIDATTRYPNDEDDYNGPDMTATIDGVSVNADQNGYGKMDDILTFYYEIEAEEPYSFGTLEVVFEGETYTFAFADIPDRTEE